jgi:uncharacterized surface protein with fasciclin (FAS1) repeats
MRSLQLLAASSLFLSPVLSQDLLERLDALGLGGFSGMMATDPTFVQTIGERNDITVWAPSNAVVEARLAATTKRQQNVTHGADISAQVDHERPPEDEGMPGKRQVDEEPVGYPDTNFHTIITFLDDPNYVNLGPGEQARFVRNFGAPSDGGVDSTPHIEVVTGLGNTQTSIRGPFKFTNGVIYEVNEFFTLPQPFTTTLQELNIAQDFYDTVVSSGNLPLFEDTPAVTIFAPIDDTPSQGNNTSNSDPEAHILTGPLSLYYSNNLMPGSTIVARSGDSIEISWAKNGERLVNCRRLVRPNVPVKNGVVHFIDGPLYGGCSETPSGPEEPPVPPAEGAASRLGGTVTQVVAFAIGAALVAFY